MTRDRGRRWSRRGRDVRIATFGTRAIVAPSGSWAPSSASLAPDGGADSAAADRCFAWLHEVDRRFSPFRPDSEVSRLADSAPPGTSEPASPEMAEVLELCEIVEVLSDGAFDIRRHRADGAPDPTGVVKGWAVDRAGEILADGGIERFCIGAGGDVLARGGRAAGLPWRIGIAHPTQAGASALTLEADDLAVATSGSTERGHHIVDGRTGQVPRELLTLSVAGPRSGPRRRLCHGRLRHGSGWPPLGRVSARLCRLCHHTGRSTHRDPRPASLPADVVTNCGPEPPRARDLTRFVLHG